MMDTRPRPVPRIGDHLDDWLDPLDRAQAEQRQRALPISTPDAPYLALIRVLEEPDDLLRSA